jgi:hypothetical protein
MARLDWTKTRIVTSHLLTDEIRANWLIQSWARRRGIDVTETDGDIKIGASAASKKVATNNGTSGSPSRDAGQHNRRRRR